MQQTRIGLLVAFLGVVGSGTIWAQEVGWSPGVVVTTNLIGPAESAAIIDAHGIVQPTALRQTAIRPAIETHLAYAISDQIGVGPFIAVALGDDIVDAIGGGILFSLTQGSTEFNIGLGYWVVPHGAVLRPDFVPGSPAPLGATEVAFVDQTVSSLAILVGIPLP